jgi:hypothetical protein
MLMVFNIKKIFGDIRIELLNGLVMLFFLIYQDILKDSNLLYKIVIDKKLGSILSVFFGILMNFVV